MRRPGRAARAGARLQAALEALPQVVSVRGAGLLLGAELVEGLDARPVAGAALDAGLIVNAVTPDTIRLAPPLLVSDDEIDEAVAILAVALADTQEGMA